MDFADEIADIPHSHERAAVIALNGRNIVIELFERNSRMVLLLAEDKKTDLKLGDRVTAHIDSSMGGARVMLEKGGFATFANTPAH